MDKEESKLEWEKAIRKALEFYENNAWDNDSTIYDVVYNGKNYPPKEIYAKAINFFLDDNPDGHVPTLGGGKPTNKFIRKHGFTVIGGETQISSRKICKMQMKSAADSKNYADEVLADNRISAHIDYAGKAFEGLNENDIVVVHKGKYPLCLVRIISKIEDKSRIQGESFGVDYDIEKLGFYSDIPESIAFKKNLNGLGFNGSFQILNNTSSKTYKFILNWLEYLDPKKHMENYIQLLKYKKQIILQGPPGTGKTRLAKQLAESITNEKEEETVLESITNFFKNFSLNEKESDARQVIEEDLAEFQNKFPKKNLKNLKLEEYALGTDDKDGFCYWLEYGLPNTGKYNGQASKGKIYWSKSDESYKKSGFVKDIEDDEEAMKMVANLLYNIANENFPEETDFPIGQGFILKVLNTYHPEKYFPINNEKLLDKLLTVLGESQKSVNYIEKSKRAMQLFLEMKSEYNTDVTAFEFVHFLFNSTNLNGNLKITESEIFSKGSYKVTQFHPSYSYEDFVRGISVKSSDEGNIKYTVEDRILVQMANEAISNPKSNFVLIIDEINRANLSSVLGELIYSLEYRYDSKISMTEGIVEGLYDKNSEGEKTDRELKIPQNLYIIGTMNTADRSVGHIDYAIRRRFAFVDILPNIDVITNDKAKALFTKVSELFTDDYLASDFDSEEIHLGHSYFLLDEKSDLNELKQLQLKLDYEILPILNEYVKDGLLLETAKELIKEIANFEC